MLLTEDEVNTATVIGERLEGLLLIAASGREIAQRFRMSLFLLRLRIGSLWVCSPCYSRLSWWT